MKRKTDDPRYKTKFSMKWRAIDRTIKRLEEDGYIVIRLAHRQRKNAKKFPSELALLALKKRRARMVAVVAGDFSPRRIEALRKFSRANDWLQIGADKPIPFVIEVWNWETMAREPIIERVA